MRRSQSSAGRRKQASTALWITLLVLAACLAGACTCRGEGGDTPPPDANGHTGEPRRGVVPEQYFKRVGQQKFIREPIGAGPFVLAEWKLGDRTVLRRNPHYWDAPRPYLDEIRLLEIPDEMTRQLKLQAGEVDMLDEVSPHQVASAAREDVHDITMLPNSESLRLWEVWKSP